MKILLSWILEHIAGDTSKVTIHELVNKFNRTVAEIEGYHTVDLKNNNLSVVQIIENKRDLVLARDIFDKSEITLASRAGVFQSQFYVVKKAIDVQWATTIDLGGSKQSPLPALYLPDSKIKTAAELLSLQEVIIEVDNKSINHRPDLWSHRGIAREIAALFDLSLKPIESFLVQKQITKTHKEALANHACPFSIAIEHPACKKFAGLYVDSVSYTATPLWMAIRLAMLDCKPIDILVDSTNYVLFDIGQPMHVFDAQKLLDRRIIVRNADQGEKLSLLDGTQAELTSQDIVIVDGQHVISLAGIMGGSETSVSSDTTAVFLESANFDATIIRKSAAFHKKRTESSMRFEKGLDPNQNVNAIGRYLALLSAEGIPYQTSSSIQSVGKEIEPIVISVSHMQIEKKLGVTVSFAQVQKILTSLECAVLKKDVGGVISYDVTVPTFRSNKDIAIAEDIIEEIGRHIGYDTIPTQLPTLQLQVKDTQSVYRRRVLKNFLTYSGKMRELYTYSFFDESFLSEIKWVPIEYIEIKNPISHNYYRLITTLFPNLFKSVCENGEQHKKLRFYEWARVWKLQDEQVAEKQVLAAIVYEQHEKIDFYTGKQLVQELCNAINLNVHFKQIETQLYPWQTAYRSAYICHEDQVVGALEMIDQQFLHAHMPGGSAYFFQLDAEYLLAYKPVIVQYNPISKYPSISRDISMFVPVSLHADSICGVISGMDTSIVKTSVIDFFQKDEWKDQRAVTVRVVMQDTEKTLTTEYADGVCEKIVALLISQGVQIR